MTGTFIPLGHGTMLDDIVVSSTVHPNVDDPMPWTAQPLASLPLAAYAVLSLSYFLGRSLSSTLLYVISISCI